MQRAMVVVALMLASCGSSDDSTKSYAAYDSDSSGDLSEDEALDLAANEVSDQS